MPKIDLSFGAYCVWDYGFTVWMELFLVKLFNIDLTINLLSWYLPKRFLEEMGSDEVIAPIFRQLYPLLLTTGNDALRHFLP